MRETHLVPLTGIRFFAAVWVVLCHLGGTLIALAPILRPLETFFSLGYLAVPLFFLLSGFILSHNYFSHYSLEQHPNFLFLRFARLWPVHFVTLALMFFYDGASFSAYPAKRWGEELLMIHSWFRADLGLNYPAWSVSAEWFAYICVFPLAFVSLKRIRSAPLLVLALGFLLAGASFVPARWILGRGGDILFLFLAGSTLYRLRCLRRTPPGSWIQNAGLLLVLIYIAFSRALPRMVIFAGFAALVFGLSYQRGLLAQALSTRSIVLGGLASYSLYMTHAVVGKVYGLFTESLPPQPPFVRLLLLALLVMGVAGAALGCYRCIEEPANKALRRWIGRSKQPARDVAAAPQPVT